MSRDDEEDDAGSDPSIPRGRLARLSRLAGLATQVGAGVAADRVRRLLGAREKGPEAAARRVLETLGGMKGAALKVGQGVALFAEHLPPEARALVGRLFSHAPALPFERIRAVLEAELGEAPGRLFAHLEEVPLAAASLAQVHAARLHSGEEVVVKVQYPGVARALDEDLDNAAALLRTLGLGGALADVDAYVAELRHEVGAELDYRRERESAEAFRAHLARWDDLVVPRTFPALSSARVLVLERLEGPTLHELTQGGGGGPGPEERWRRSLQLLRAVWGPWIFERAIHADTHPGNYVAMPDGRLGVLDFGSVKHGSEALWRASLEGLWALFRPELPVDWLALARRAGFHWGLPDERVRAVLEEIVELLRPGTRGEWDWGADTTMQHFAQLKLRHPLDFLRIRAPAESLLVGRALAGLMQNLKRLGGRGDIRPFFLGALAEALEGAPPPPPPR